MGWREDQREMAEEVRGELAGIRRVLTPAPEEIRAYPPLGRFPALRTALRLCRDVGQGDGLAKRFRRVPDEYVDGPERRVRCMCGAVVGFGDLTPCPGECGRWFAADESGAWAALLAEPENGETS